MPPNIVIIGAGQAGAQAVDTLRREGFDGGLVLVGDEAELPYQRPPLSKKYLLEDMAADRLVLRHRSFYDEHHTELLLGATAVQIDRARHAVALADGRELRYDRLLLCLGVETRRLSCPGSDLPGVHYLRRISDAQGIRAGFKSGARAVVVGGGYIGLETAAACRASGMEVTVLEAADRLMNRVVSPAVSAYFLREHQAHGVRFVFGAMVERLEGAGRVERVLCANGSAHAADLTIAGIGASGATALAAAAGLACDNGIVVDEFCRTSDADIFAAGDCTNHPSLHYGGRVRLESVDNAFEQAKAAALNLLGRAVVYDRIPWFWSDQFDNKLLIVGLTKGCDGTVIRGRPETRSFSVCYLKDRELLAVEAVNHSKDFMAAKKLIAERTRLDPQRLGDPLIALKDAV